MLLLVLSAYRFGGRRRLTVLLSTLQTRDLGRLRCCLWQALVRLPAAAGSWSLFLSLVLSPSLIAYLLPRLIPTPPPQETTSALRTPFQSNLSFISTVKTCSTRCRLPTGCFKQVCSSRFGYRQQVAKRTRMGLWSAKSALSWAVVMTTGGKGASLSCRLGGSDRRIVCSLSTVGGDQEQQQRQRHLQPLAKDFKVLSLVLYFSKATPTITKLSIATW